METETSDRPDLALSVEETRSVLGVSRQTVYALLRSGQLVSFTIGTARRIPSRSLRQYMARRLEAEAARRSA